MLVSVITIINVNNFLMMTVETTFTTSLHKFQVSSDNVIL